MILIITNRTDVTTDFIVNELRRRGLAFTRFNTDEYPINIDGTFETGSNNKFNSYLYFKDRNKLINLSRINAILYRRPVPPVPDKSISNESIRKFCIDESYDFIRGLWLSIDGFWISSPESIRKAEHKIYQLSFAQKCGFLIPKTIITNTPNDLKRFIETTEQRIIIKPLYSGFIKEEQDEPLMIYTTIIDKTDINEIENISYAPSIFQEYIDKEFDVRVTIVGNTVFSARIDSHNLPQNIPDWRFADLENLDHSIYPLPEEIKYSCLQLVRNLNLEFGGYIKFS